MTIETYPDLLGSVAAWMNRDDLTDRTPDFVTLAEAQMQRDIRHPDMEAETALTPTGRYIALPDDWLATIRVDHGGRKLQAIGSERAGDLRLMDGGAQALYWTPVGRRIEVFPAPTGDVTLRYYKRIPPLTHVDSSNWLLGRAPDAYLYGALLQAAPYLMEDQRAQTWGSLYAAAVRNLNAAGERGQWGSDLRVQVGL